MQDLKLSSTYAADDPHPQAAYSVFTKGICYQLYPTKMSQWVKNNVIILMTAAHWMTYFWF